MVFYSARFMADIHRPNFEFTEVWQRVAFFLGMFSTMLLAAMMMWLKTDLLKNKARLEQGLD